MNRLVRLVCAFGLAVAGSWCALAARAGEPPELPLPAQTPELTALQASARDVDRMDNVQQRHHVDAYYALADAYARLGRDRERRAELTRALTLDSGNFDRQLEAARLEIAAGEPARAHDRLTAVLESNAPPAVHETASAMASDLRAHGFTPAPLAAPRMVDRLLTFVVFEGTDPAVVVAIAQRVGVAFGLRTEVVATPLSPTLKGMRTSFFAPGGMQYDGHELMLQLLAHPARGAPKSVGVIGVLRGDMFAGDSRYQFGAASAGVGVVSIARFGGDGVPPETALNRATKQAFSTTGFVLGAERCSSPSCVRAYPHSMDELDRKGHSLCRACLANIDRVLGRAP